MICPYCDGQIDESIYSEHIRKHEEVFCVMGDDTTDNPTVDLTNGVNDDADDDVQSLRRRQDIEYAEMCWRDEAAATASSSMSTQSTLPAVTTVLSPFDIAAHRESVIRKVKRDADLKERHRLASLAVNATENATENATAVAASSTTVTIKFKLPTGKSVTRAFATHQPAYALYNFLMSVIADTEFSCHLYSSEPVHNDDCALKDLGIVSNTCITVTFLPDEYNIAPFHSASPSVSRNLEPRKRKCNF